MNPQIQRRPTLQKAVATDVVASLTAPATPETGGEAGPEPAPAPEPGTPPRRGPGRPRSRRRMEPFSSKIEIGLRDQVDAYTVEHDESIVDLLDRALRAAIAEPPRTPNAGSLSVGES